MNNEKLISPVKNRNDKQNTYRVQMGKYRKAIREGFYFEAMIIVYAVLEDRLKSFLYYIGAVRKIDDEKLNVCSTKSILRSMFFGSEEDAMNRKLDINSLGNKEKLIRVTIEWAENQMGAPENSYLASLKSEYEGCLDMGGLIQTLDEIDQWKHYRNEIVHGLMNKNMDSLKMDISKYVEEGMEYARFIDSQVSALKKRNRIRIDNKIKD